MPQLQGNLAQKSLQGAVAVHADKALVQHVRKVQGSHGLPARLVGGDQHQTVGAEVQAGEAVRIHLARDDAQIGPAFTDVRSNHRVRTLFKSTLMCGCSIR